jgi:hypothetical protein
LQGRKRLHLKRAKVAVYDKWAIGGIGRHKGLVNGSSCGKLHDCNLSNSVNGLLNYISDDLTPSQTKDVILGGVET